jgi:hypothetical protein
MLVPVRSTGTQGLVDELIDPGIDVGFGFGFNFRLGPAEPYRDGVRSHTRFVPLILPLHKVELTAFSIFEDHRSR